MFDDINHSLNERYYSTVLHYSTVLLYYIIIHLDILFISILPSPYLSQTISRIRILFDHLGRTSIKIILNVPANISSSNARNLLIRIGERGDISLYKKCHI